MRSTSALLVRMLAGAIIFIRPNILALLTGYCRAGTAQRGQSSPPPSSGYFKTQVSIFWFVPIDPQSLTQFNTQFNSFRQIVFSWRASSEHSLLCQNFFSCTPRTRTASRLKVSRSLFQVAGRCLRKASGEHQTQLISISVSLERTRN